MQETIGDVGSRKLEFLDLLYKASTGTMEVIIVAPSLAPENPLDFDLSDELFSLFGLKGGLLNNFKNLFLAFDTAAFSPMRSNIVLLNSQYFLADL